MLNYKQQIILELAEKIKSEGFRVFIAEKGNYGFYTDNEGKRLVYFQMDLTLTFSGNYESENNGRGWQIIEGMPTDFKELLYTNSPFQFHHYTTLDEYLNIYQKSSKFKEI